VSAPVCDRVATIRLEAGHKVFTTEPVGSDFGLPLVRPTHARRRSQVRMVRNRVHTQGGTVVWFTDGTKTPPLHGRTAWDLA
jgi:hypothetical protein